MTVHVAATLPYAWPYDGRLDGSGLALIALGWDQAWTTRVDDPEAATARCRGLGEAVLAHGGAVIAVSHADAPSLPFVGGRHLSVPGLDAFYGSPLDHWLRHDARTHLLILGLGLEGPVHSSLRSANDRGYECLLVVDACAPSDRHTAEAATKTVTMSGGIFGAIGTSQAVLDALGSHAPSLPSPDLQEH